MRKLATAALTIALLGLAAAPSHATAPRPAPARVAVCPPGYWTCISPIERPRPVCRVWSCASPIEAPGHPVRRWVLHAFVTVR